MLTETLAIVRLVNTGLGILKNLSNETELLMAKYDEIVKSLQIQDVTLRRIEGKIDNQVIRLANKSAIYLIDAMRCEHKVARNNSLSSAYEGFTELICLDPNENTVGTSVTIPNKKLISLGYLGRFIYYCILGCYKDALIQVYEFTSLYPDTGVEIFDSRFFSKEYKDLLKNCEYRINELHKQLDKGYLLVNDEGIPNNQLLPLVEIEEESLKQEIVKESKSFLIYLLETNC
ncbi:MAG: hypothetical protein AB4372_05690 [Xenococcus sp. (in: cyanobacteria)]